MELFGSRRPLPRGVLANRHVQTLTAALPAYVGPRRAAGVAHTQVTIPIAPAGAIVAEVARHVDGRRRDVVVLVHGVAGSSRSAYLVRAAHAFEALGADVVRVNLRGAGDTAHLAPSLYHAGLTEDFRATAAWAAANWPESRVYFLGFSLGGNALLTWLAREREGIPSAVHAAASVSAPVDLEETCVELERWRSWPYHTYVLASLVAQAARYARAHPERSVPWAAQLRRLRRVRDYDELVIAPMHGYEGASDYYARESAGPRLSAIQLPTLMVHAADDPMVTIGSLGAWVKTRAPAVRFSLSREGGHVGWVHGLHRDAWRRTWAIDAIATHFAEHGLRIQPASR